MRHLLLFFILTLVTRGSYSRRNLTFFECVFDDINQPCDPIREPPLAELFDAFRNNVHFMNCSSNSSESFKNDEILPIPPVLLFMIPEDYLMLMDMQNIFMQIRFYSENQPLVRKLLEAVVSSGQKTAFWAWVRKNNSIPGEPIKNLVEIGIQLENGEIFNELYYFYYLAHLPGKYIALNEGKTGSKLDLYFSVFLNSDVGWRLSTKTEKRLWSYITFKHGIHGHLSKWNSDVLQKNKNVLIGATPDELSSLNKTLLTRPVFVWYPEFTPLQIRSLFNLFYGGKHLSSLDFDSLRNIAHYLTPSQLIQFYPNASFRMNTPAPLCTSVASAKQIMEFQRIEMFVFDPHSVSSEFERHTKFIFAKPLTYFKQFIEHPVEMRTLRDIGSSCLSNSQVYSLLGRGEGLNLFYDDLTTCEVCLRALSTKKFLSQNNGLSKDKLNFILSNLKPVNMPLTFAVLDKIWNILEDNSILQSIFDNEDYATYLSFVPPKEIMKMGVVDIFSRLRQNFTMDKPLPPLFASTVLHQHDLLQWEWESLVNSSVKFSTVFQGLTCQDINKMLPMDFVAVMAFYNQYKKSNNKIFPKELQICGGLKLLDYLSVKGVLYESRPVSLLSLLSYSDTMAVGGPLLIGFPPAYLNDGILRPKMLNEIGRMSLSEMLLNARITTFRKLYSLFVHEHALDSTLFELGNLTLLLGSSEIQKIKPETFKLLLESDYIDKRLCATTKERQEWTKIIINAFGDPSSWTSGILETLGDMLVVIPDPELSKVRLSVWIEMGDQLHTRYFDTLSENSKVTYFDICLDNLKSTESGYYQNAVIKMILRHLGAAQLQLNTVKTFNPFIDKNINSSFHSQITTLFSPSSSNMENTTPSIILTTNDTPPPVTNSVSSNGHSSINQNTTQETPNKTIFIADDSEHPLNSSLSTHFPTPEVPLKRNGTTILVEAATQGGKLPVSLNTTLDTISNSASVRETTPHNTVEETKIKEIKPFETFQLDVYPSIKSPSHTSLDLGSIGRMEFLDSSEFVNSSLEEEDWTKQEVWKRSRRSETSFKISCDAFKMIGKPSGKVLQIYHISAMTDEELNDCSELFGQMDLSDDIKDAIWKRISKKPFHLLGSLVSEAKIGDIEEILSNPTSSWFLEEIFLLGLHNKDTEVRNAVLKWVEGSPQPLKISEVVALGPLVCQLKDTERAISPNIFLKTSVYLGKTLPCHCDSMAQLAVLAESEHAYGNVSTWTSEDVEALGCIVTGLKKDKWRLLNNSTKNPLYGLKSHVAYHLPLEFIQDLSEKAIKNLRMSTASALLDKAKYILSENQIYLLNTYYQNPFSEHSLESGTGPIIFNKFITLVMLLQLLVFACY